jgi:hypothetical protein
LSEVDTGSDRLFDSLEGRKFSSARDAERAAHAVFIGTTPPGERAIVQPVLTGRKREWLLE